MWLFNPRTPELNNWFNQQDDCMKKICQICLCILCEPGIRPASVVQSSRQQHQVKKEHCLLSLRDSHFALHIIPTTYRCKMPRYPPFRVALQGQLRIENHAELPHRGNSTWSGHAELPRGYAEISSTLFSHQKKFVMVNAIVNSLLY